MSELTLKEQGDKFLKNGLWRDAVDAYTCVLEATAEIRPEDAAILVSRSRCYAALGDLASAEVDVKTALGVIPDNAKVIRKHGLFSSWSDFTPYVEIRTGIVSSGLHIIGAE